MTDLIPLIQGRRSIRTYGAVGDRWARSPLAGLPPACKQTNRVVLALVEER
jgi:hypothetical protein